MASRHQALSLLHGLLLALAFLSSPTEMVTVRCFSAMDNRTLTCIDLIGDQVEEADCCLNPSYCFQRELNGVSALCRKASEWSGWSDWSPCSVSCQEGVQQRRKVCLGQQRCMNTEKLQARPCVERPCCQVDGGWSAWVPWGPCSVTCSLGQQVRSRTCSQPAPVCGGQCHGHKEEHRSCDTNQICPTHGSWSAWGQWGPCSASCQEEGSGSAPIRRRTRSCNDPPPSKEPPGRPCPGDDSDTGRCDFLPFCPVDGNWGPWSPPIACSVSCGIGKRQRQRQCNQPAPKHGGAPCQGSHINHTVCNTQLPCPVDGLWLPWSWWSDCHRSGFKIECQSYVGLQDRTRRCVGMAHGGQHCHGSTIQVQSCYNADGCDYGKGIWTEWGDWSTCTPACGPGSVQRRRRTCEPVYPNYPKEAGILKKEPVHFWGFPIYECDELEGQKKQLEQTKPCFNVPDCD